MKKYTIAILSLLIVVSLSTTATLSTQASSTFLCKSIEEFATPSGCWTSCTSSQFNQCGDVFPALYNPSFCAYTKDGRYVSYTYSCQACKSPDVVAVRNGACSCDFIKCNSDQICQDGSCISPYPTDPVDLCLNVRCPANNICQNGKCIEQFKPCSQLCIQGFICVNGQCIPQKTPDQINSCAAITCPVNTICQNGKCIALGKPCTQLCIQGYRCVNGQCRPQSQINSSQPHDLCALIRCRQGYYCEKGSCIAQPGLCGVVVCDPSFVCQNGQCVDPSSIDLACATIRCDSSRGFYCQNGTCVKKCNGIRVLCTDPRPDEESCPTLTYIMAPQPTVCGVSTGGQLIGYPRQCDACKDKLISYYWNKKCQDLVGCVKGRCLSDIECQFGLSCSQGSCINKCLTVKCYAGTHCFKGACVPDVIVELSDTNSKI